MIWVSIETTGPHLGLGIYEEAKNGALRVMAESWEPAVAQQAEKLVPTLKKMLKKKTASINAVAVDVGPGSFTGVRVGLASARALAHALNIPLVGVCGLEAMAESLGKPAALIGAFRPALSGDVYAAAYQNGKTILEPCWRKETWWNQWRAKRKALTLVSDVPTPRGVVDVARRYYTADPSSKQFHALNVHALYLQPSWAERTLRDAKRR